MGFQDSAAEEDGGQHVAMTDGVGLEARSPSQCLCCDADEPQRERGECGDEKQHLEPFWALGTGVAQGESPAVAFQVPECFFDLHSLRVQTLDQAGGTALVRER